MEKSETVTREQWLKARLAFMAKEKVFTKQRDALTRERQSLPRVKLDKEYIFKGPDGKLSLSDLFAGHSQLIVYHFMFGEDWTEGCPSCSFWADGYDGIIVHLNARDINMVAVSKTPLANLQAYQKRMGWSFNWLSSLGNDFNADFRVSFTPEDLVKDGSNYNFGTQRFNGPEAPGLSVFQKGPDGSIYHTYSAFARGLDIFNNAYHYMDVAPKGRDEDDLPYPMAWLKRHDSYETP